MEATLTPRCDAQTFLSHLVGGLNDDGYDIQHFVTMADGRIVPVHRHGAAEKGTAQNSPHDRQRACGRQGAPLTGRGHHRDEGQAAQLQPAAMGVMKPVGLHRPSPARLTLRRRCRRYAEARYRGATGAGIPGPSSQLAQTSGHA